MFPFGKLFHSRKFLLLLLDTIVSLILWGVGMWFPEAADSVNELILIMQPVFIAVITGIAIEDAAEKRAGDGPIG